MTSTQLADLTTDRHTQVHDRGAERGAEAQPTLFAPSFDECVDAVVDQLHGVSAAIDAALHRGDEPCGDGIAGPYFEVGYCDRIVIGSVTVPQSQQCPDFRRAARAIGSRSQRRLPSRHILTRWLPDGSFLVLFFAWVHDTCRGGPYCNCLPFPHLVEERIAS